MMKPLRKGAEEARNELPQLLIAAQCVFRTNVTADSGRT